LIEIKGGLKMFLNRSISRLVLLILILLIAVSLTACSTHSAKRAGEGAAMGAVVGAAGGMVSALVFGGNVGEAAARGAVWGGTTGAVAGGISGAQQDQVKKAQQEQAKKAQQEKSIEKLKKELGEDAFNGLVALTECKHEVALGYARTAARSENKDYALAGLWLEILAYADQKKEDMARQLFPNLIAKDSKISVEAQAEETMRKAMQRLMDIRGEYNLPKTCG
jgi:hypothetical protein